MGALADWDAYAAALTGPRELAPFHKLGVTTGIAGRVWDLWQSLPLLGAAPSTAVVPTRSTAGALGQSDADSEQSYIVGGRLATTMAGLWVLCDRLSHQGGLSGTVTTPQTTNLPTAALTRYTSGAGVWCALSIYAAVGTTAASVTVSYTNQAGTSGRTSTAVVFGSANFRELSRLVLIPPQAGDTGFRSVESVTVLSTTGSAGNFGVTLFRPLAAFMVDTASGQTSLSLADGGMFGGVPEVVDDACLFWMVIPGLALTPSVGGDVRFMAV
ncbi:MAG: hypothetical protein OEV62_00240 [Actinomycetota bacterium]|nr:hypothetical protein [Actinomycetota bacterium]